MHFFCYYFFHAKKKTYSSRKEIVSHVLFKHLKRCPVQRMYTNFEQCAKLFTSISYDEVMTLRPFTSWCITRAYQSALLKLPSHTAPILGFVAVSVPSFAFHECC